MLWCAMAAIIVGSTATFAWYGTVKREADSESAEVMKPYYLTLLNPSESDSLQLSIGNLFPGDVKQIVFCVSNKSNDATVGLDMGVTTFNYSIELIHTENLALEYNIYELTNEGVTESDKDAIAALDTITVTNENGTKEETVTTYWKKVGGLQGIDVTETRHKQAGITDGNGSPINASILPVNAGKYTSYTEGRVPDATGNFPKLQLQGGVDDDNNPQFTSQYFLLEINWTEEAASNFEQYEKETDMIYLLVEALQPQPQEKMEDTTTNTTTE